MSVIYRRYAVASMGALLSTYIVAEELAPIEIKGKILNCSNERVLMSISLKNASPREIYIQKDFLPWGISSSIFLVAVQTRPDATLLRRVLFIDDPRGLDSQRIAASEAVSGRIDLLRRFDGLIGAIQKSDVFVFWSYEAPLEGSGMTSRESGSVVLKKGSCGAKQAPPPK